MANIFRPGAFDRVRKAVGIYSSGSKESISSAARKAHTTPKTIRRVNERLGLLKYDEDRRNKPEAYTLTIINSKGTVVPTIIVDKANATLFSKYIHSIVDATRFGMGDSEFKARANKGITDIYGRHYKLTNSIDTLLAILNSNDLSFDDLFYPKK